MRRRSGSRSRPCRFEPPAAKKAARRATRARRTRRAPPDARNLLTDSGRTLRLGMRLAPPSGETLVGTGLLAEPRYFVPLGVRDRPLELSQRAVWAPVRTVIAR